MDARREPTRAARLPPNRSTASATGTRASASEDTTPATRTCTFLARFSRQAGAVGSALDVCESTHKPEVMRWATGKAQPHAMLTRGTHRSPRLRAGRERDGGRSVNDGEVAGLWKVLPARGDTGFPPQPRTVCSAQQTLERT